MAAESVGGTWMPKADGQLRPLGLAAVEDKIVQQATKTVLECVYKGGLPRLQLRVSTRTRMPQRTGCVVGGSYEREK